MVIDNKNNLANYEDILPGITQVMSVISSLDEYIVGRYELDSGFYMIQEGVTIPLEENLFEAHEKYIDVQIMIEGKEMVEWANAQELQLCRSYDEIKDIKFYSGSGTPYTIESNMAYILFPTDGHKPCCHIGQIATKYKKIVIKLPYKK